VAISSVIPEMKHVDKVDKTRINKITRDCQLRRIVHINWRCGDKITAV